MNRSLATTQSRTRIWTDYLALTKPRIATLVAFSAFVGALLAAGPAAQIGQVLEAALWVTHGGSRERLQPSARARCGRAHGPHARAAAAVRRLSTRNAIVFGTGLAVAGVAGLAVRFNLLSAFFALATLFAYVAVYTPLKRVSTLNTLVGALPGAAPPLIGYTALAGTPGTWGLLLFAIVFVWQFPHFMAIAWLYRADYARAGLRMLPAIAGCERVAARSAFVHSLALVPIALLPGVAGEAGVVYSASALVLSVAYAAFSARFALKADARSARLLLFVSLAYLPLVLISILLDPVVGVGALHGRL